MLHMVRDEPYFAKFYGFSTNPATMLLKFYHLGSLMAFIAGESRKSGKYVYSKRQVVSMLKKLAIGYVKMHELKYAHLDIKPDNVLLELDTQTGLLVPAITDFGISRLVDASVKQVAAFELSTVKGLSARYASPQTFVYFRGHT